MKWNVHHYVMKLIKIKHFPLSQKNLETVHRMEILFKIMQILQRMYRVLTFLPPRHFAVFDG